MAVYYLYILTDVIGVNTYTSMSSTSTILGAVGCKLGEGHTDSSMETLQWG